MSLPICYRFLFDICHYQLMRPLQYIMCLMCRLSFSYAPTHTHTHTHSYCHQQQQMEMFKQSRAACLNRAFHISEKASPLLILKGDLRWAERERCPSFRIKMT